MSDSERITRLEERFENIQSLFDTALKHLETWVESENGNHQRHITELQKEVDRIKGDFQKAVYGDNENPGMFEEFRSIKSELKTQGGRQTWIITSVIGILYTSHQLGIGDIISALLK